MYSSLFLQIYAVVQNPSNRLRSDSIVGCALWLIQTQRIIFPVCARIGDAQYKLEVEWKIHFYRLRRLTYVHDADAHCGSSEQRGIIWAGRLLTWGSNDWGLIDITGWSGCMC